MAYQGNQQTGFQYGGPSYPNPGYPPNNPGFPPNNPGYPPNNPGYPPNNPGYPPNNFGYPPNNPGYPPNNTGYPPQNPGYPANNPGYQGGGQGYQQPYDTHSGYPPGNHQPGWNSPGPQPYQSMPQPYAENKPEAHSTPVDKNPNVAPNSEQILDPEKLVPQGKAKEKKLTDEEKKELGFNDKTIRRGFIRKVYTILFFQLLITCGVIAMMLYHEPTQKYVENHQELFWISLGTLIIAIILMSCCVNLRRMFPLNYIFLIVFTACESILMGLAASTFNADVVLMAAGVTVGVCLLLTLFAFQTKIDFTFLSGALFVGIFILIICGITAAIVQSKALMMLYAGIGVFLFSLYLIYDTQVIVGGKHEHNISPEEYIFASLSLYLDVMRIFSFVLILFGICKG